LAPQLYDRYQNDRWLITKTGIATRETAKLVIGKKHMLAKLITVAVIGLVLFTIFYKPVYHVTPTFTLAAIDKRTVCAPFEGVIEKVFVKPGDMVAEGAPLLKMRTTDLELERNSQLRDAEKAEEEARKYGYSSGSDAKQAESQAKFKEAAALRAKAALLADRISRATVRAPLAGEVLTGADLREKQGAPVKLGDALLDVGDKSRLRAELLVPERDIQDIREGMTGRIATNAMPSDKRPITVDTIVQQGQPKEGENLFKVYATLNSLDPAWRPGMQGEAQIDVGRRRFIWVYTHRLMDFLQLKMWKWM
jgi:multidrug efflux pump subunit AcrA (membrane-fusion protein)